MQLRRSCLTHLSSIFRASELHIVKPVGRCRIWIADMLRFERFGRLWDNSVFLHLKSTKMLRCLRVARSPSNRKMMNQKDLFRRFSRRLKGLLPAHRSGFCFSVNFFNFHWRNSLSTLKHDTQVSIWNKNFFSTRTSQRLLSGNFFQGTLKLKESY